MSPGTVVSPAWSQCCRRILPSRGCLVSWAPLPALPRRELLLSELTTSNKFPILFVFETGVKNQAVLCHVTGDKPHGRGGAMCTTCCRVPLLLGVPTQVSEKSRGHCTILGFGTFSDFCHSNPQGYLYTFTLSGDKKCPHTCRQWIVFYFSRTSFTSGSVALSGFGT